MAGRPDRRIEGGRAARSRLQQDRVEVEAGVGGVRVGQPEHQVGRAIRPCPTASEGPDRMEDAARSVPSPRQPFRSRPRDGRRGWRRRRGDPRRPGCRCRRDGLPARCRNASGSSGCRRCPPTRMTVRARTTVPSASRTPTARSPSRSTEATSELGMDRQVGGPLLRRQVCPVGRDAAAVADAHRHRPDADGHAVVVVRDVREPGLAERLDGRKVDLGTSSGPDSAITGAGHRLPCHGSSPKSTSDSSRRNAGRTSAQPSRGCRGPPRHRSRPPRRAPRSASATTFRPAAALAAGVSNHLTARVRT